MTAVATSNERRRSIALRMMALLPVVLAGHVLAAGVNASGDYDEDLTRVWRGIKISEFSRDVCAEHYPDYKAINERSYAAWYSENERLINDISERVLAMARRKANAEPDPSKRARIFVSYTELPADRAAVREQLMSRGPEWLSANCATWAFTSHTNIERDWAAPLETVRRFPVH